MKKYTLLITLSFCILLFFNQSEPLQSQYLLSLIDVTDEMIGFSTASITTAKYDSVVKYAYFNQYFMGNENLKNTELLIRMHDTSNTKGKFPKIRIQYALAKAEDNLVLLSQDSIGYWIAITESLKVYNKWVHFTLKNDSIRGIVEAVAIKIKNMDTTGIDSNRTVLVDFKLNTR